MVMLVVLLMAPFAFAAVVALAAWMRKPGGRPGDHAPPVRDTCLSWSMDMVCGGTGRLKRTRWYANAEKAEDDVRCPGCMGCGYPLTKRER